MLDCFLAASYTWNDSNLCKSSSISFPTSWKRQKFCKVFNAFVISMELGFTTGSSNISIPSSTIFQRRHCWRDLFLDFSKPDISRLNFLKLSFHLNEDMLPEGCWKKKKENKLPNKVLSMHLLKSECLKWTVWFIRKPHSNVRDSGWETAQKWLKGLRKLFDIVKVRVSRVRDTERIYKGN